MLIPENFDDWSEEDLRTRVICPLLTSFGYQLADLKIEHGFCVRIGRESVKRPRADIIVSREGNVLFIVECKRPSHTFLQRDREQAISYARLVQPRIAPLAILTNGMQTEVIDTLTGQVINESIDNLAIDGWKSVGVDETIRLRNEAMPTLLCLSSSNLLDFVTRELDRVCKSSLRPTFEPKYNVVRTEVLSELKQQCINGAGNMSVMTGASTIGKSTAILSFAHQCLQTQPPEVLPLYIPLNISGPDFPGYITSIFDWQFHGTNSTASLIANLDRIALTHKIKCIAYLIDGGDIIDLDALRQTIERFLSNTETLNCRHRVILCVQASTWQYLQDGRGIDLRRRMGEAEVRLHPFTHDQQLEHRTMMAKKYGVSLARLPFHTPWDRPALLAIAAELMAKHVEEDLVSADQLWKTYLEYQIKN